MKRRTAVLHENFQSFSLARMGTLLPSDKAFTVSQNYADKSPVQIQRRFTHDVKTVQRLTVSMCLALVRKPAVQSGSPLAGYQSLAQSFSRNQARVGFRNQAINVAIPRNLTLFSPSLTAPP